MPAGRNPTRVFISYSWDTPDHKEWVTRLATSLEEIPDLHVILDDFDLYAGKDLTLFMDKALESERVIVVSTPTYVTKAEHRQGGVGYECSKISAELARDQSQDKFIPLLRSGNQLPSFLDSKYHVDGREPRAFERILTETLSAIRREPLKSRPPKNASLSDKKNSPLTVKELLEEKRGALRAAEMQHPLFTNQHLSTGNDSFRPAMAPFYRFPYLWLHSLRPGVIQYTNGPSPIYAAWIDLRRSNGEVQRFIGPYTLAANEIGTIVIGDVAYAGDFFERDTVAFIWIEFFYYLTRRHEGEFPSDGPLRVTSRITIDSDGGVRMRQDM